MLIAENVNLIPAHSTRCFVDCNIRNIHTKEDTNIHANDAS